MPAAAAEAGSKASLASTSAQTSPRAVARASAESNTLVLPDEGVPQISVRQPRARPPVSKSSWGMPLDTISGDERTSRREAGTTAASFGMASTRAKISAVERGEDRGEKIKGRLMAVDEKTGEADILSHIVREHEGRISSGEVKYSRFVRLYEYPISGLLLSRKFVKNHELVLQLKGLTMLCGEIFASEIAPRSGGSLQTHRRRIRTSFCYNRTSSQSTRVALSSRG